MKMKLISLYDRVAQKHLPIWQADNELTAKRALAGALKSDQHLALNHQDFDVMCVGDFDLVEGSIIHTYTHICTLSSCKEA